MKTCKISTKDRVYENFKEFASDPKNNVDEKALLVDLLAYAKYYSSFLYYHSDNQKINDYLEQVLILKSTTVYPVLLYIFDDCFKNKKLSENDLVEVLKVLISYIFRREICAYPTNALNKIFANLITARARIIINDTNANMKSPHRISDHLYIETNLNAITLLNYCQMICNHYSISDEVFFMLTKK